MERGILLFWYVFYINVKIIFLLSLGGLGISDMDRCITDIFLNNAEGLNFNKLVKDDLF